MKLNTRKINGKKAKRAKKIVKKTRKLNRKNNKKFIVGGTNKKTFETVFDESMNEFDNINEIITINNDEYYYTGQGANEKATGFGKMIFKTDEKVQIYKRTDSEDTYIICKEYVGKLVDNETIGYGVMILTDEQYNQYKWVGGWSDGFFLIGIKYKYEIGTWIKYEEGIYFDNFDNSIKTFDYPNITFDEFSKSNSDQSNSHRNSLFDFLFRFLHKSNSDQSNSYQSNSDQSNSDQSNSYRNSVIDFFKNQMENKIMEKLSRNKIQQYINSSTILDNAIKDNHDKAKQLLQEKLLKLKKK